MQKSLPEKARMTKSSDPSAMRAWVTPPGKLFKPSEALAEDEGSGE